MQFLRAILTPLVAATLLAATAPLVMAQNRGDDTLLEMQQAFRKGDRNKLAQLLPAARGHALEPWAAYWELRVRLGEASPQEIQSFMQRYAGLIRRGEDADDAFVPAFIEQRLEAPEILLAQSQSRRGGVAAEAQQQAGRPLRRQVERIAQVQAGNRAAGALQLAGAAAGEGDHRAVQLVLDARGEDADDALVPGRVVEREAGAIGGVDGIEEGQRLPACPSRCCAARGSAGRAAARCSAPGRGRR